MTKVSNELRSSLYHTIMKDLPSRDYAKEIHAVVQEVVLAHAPKQVQELYADENTRKYVNQGYVEVSKGNQHVVLYRNGGSGHVYGLKGQMTIRMDDAENTHRMPDGSLYKDVVTRLANEGLVTAYFAQYDLRKSVSERLRANLKAATTIKRLYEVLEPELHHYIPKDEVKANLPACVAPVVDDLRKLGAVLPEVAKVVQ